MIVREKGETQSSKLLSRLTVVYPFNGQRSNAIEMHGFLIRNCAFVNLRQIQSIFSSLYRTVLIGVSWLKQSYKNLRFFLTGFAFLFDLFVLTTLHFYSCQLLFDEKLQRI